MDRRTFLTLAGGGFLWVLSGCSGNRGIRIVSSLPRTGSAQGQTDTIVNGIRMAIEEYNGEIAGLPIDYVDKDDATAAQGQWDAGKEADNAREAIADRNVLAYIGPYNSGASMVSQPILNDAGLVQISPSATWPGLTKKVPNNTKDEPAIYRPSGKINFCRVCPNDFVQGPLSALFAHEQLKVKSVYVLDDKELYGAGIATIFKQKCEELGIKVLGHDSIVATQKNFKSVIQGIRKLGPDMVYFGGTSQSGGPQIAIDMLGEGLHVPLMVPDGCYEKAFIDAAGADTFQTIPCYATMGGYDPAFALEQGGSVADFVKRYQEKYKKMPEAYAVYGYECAKVILEAIRKVGQKDRDAVREAVLATKDFDKGALGRWSFDADGDTTLRVLTISRIVDGAFKPQRTIKD
ncbi:MAG: branched-chain amino acid ABC transporter substrate-binding protein [Gemmataceae bacterium]|nr:branched-chain amino acid ABC transporter substrate-binding protein [Gemmataceae bacterium]MDW8243281.1 branched-chain amino acid ABC transporter substrate-binding protein [Thermogemmata sp.]